MQKAFQDFNIRVKVLNQLVYRAWRHGLYLRVPKWGEVEKVSEVLKTHGEKVFYVLYC